MRDRATRSSTRARQHEIGLEIGLQLGEREGACSATPRHGNSAGVTLINGGSRGSGICPGGTIEPPYEGKRGDGQ